MGKCKRCLIYVRVSGHKRQLEGASLEVQLDDCHRVAEREGWEVVGVEKDTVSGLVETRSGYQNVLEQARKGAIDIVLIWRLDRFARDDGEGIQRANELDKRKVELISATQGRLDPMTRGILFVVAKQESRNTSERVHPNLLKFVEKGLWPSRPPFGYEMDSTQKGRLLIKEPEAGAMRACFERFGAGESAYRLVGWLNSRADIQAPHGRLFSEQWLTRALQKKVYIGKVEWNKRSRSKIRGQYTKEEEEWVCYPGLHEALVSEELFGAVQERFAAIGPQQRGRKPGANFLLTGIVKCGMCGNGMYGNYYQYFDESRLAGKRHGHGKAFQGYTYRCPHKGHMKVSGRVTRGPDHSLDSFVLALIADFPIGRSLVEMVEKVTKEHETQDRNPRINELEAAKGKQEERKRRLRRLLVDGVISDEEYLEDAREIERAVRALDSEMDAIRPSDKMKEELEAISALLGRLEGECLWDVLREEPIDNQAPFVRLLVRSVTYHGKQREPEVEWTEVAKALVGFVGGE